MKFKLKRQIIRRLWFAAWGVVAAMVIVVALVFSVIRMLLPYAADYKHEVEETLTQLSGYQVSIGTIEAHWSWFTPQIRLNRLSVSDPQTNDNLYEIETVKVGVDCLSSLMLWKIDFSYVDIVGTDIAIVREEDHILVGGQKISLGSEPSNGHFKILDALNNKTLRLLDSRIDVHDKVLGMHNKFVGVNTAFRNFDDSRELFVSLEFPGAGTETFDIAFDLTGRREDPLSWNGNAYAKAESLDLKRVARYIPGLQTLQGGLINFELWFDWKDIYHMEVRGNVELRNAVLSPAGHAETATNIESASMELYAKRSNNEIEGVIENLKFNQGDSVWEPSGWAVNAELNEAHELQDILASIDYMRFQDLLPLLERMPHAEGDLISKIEEFDPKGEIQNLFLYWNSKKEFNLITEFQNIGISGGSSMPSVSGLSGRIDLDKAGGQVYIDSQNISLAFDTVFREPLLITQLNSVINIYHFDDEIVLASDRLELATPDVKTYSNFAVWLGGPKGLYMDVFSKFDEAELQNKSLYLPAGIMPEGVLNWLDNAVIGGTLKNVEFEFKGYAADFPFRKGNGVFRAETDFEKAELEYLNGWPKAYGLTGHLKFYGPSMYADVYSAKTYQGEITSTTAAIYDLLDPTFVIDAYAFSSVPDAVRFIRESGLKDMFHPIINEVDVSGFQGSWLSLSVPMTDNPEVQYFGDTTLFDMSLNLEAYNVHLSRLDGQLYFSRDEVEAESMQVLFNKKDSVFSVGTVSDSNGKVIQFEVGGRYSFKDLLGEYMPAALSLVEGDSSFSARLSVPFATKAKTAALPNIVIKSNLRGISSQLPAPLGKQANESKALYVSNQFLPGDLANLDFHYDEWLKGRLLLGKETGGSLGVVSGDVRLQNSYPKITKNKGVSIFGYLNRFDLDGWFEVKNKFSKPNESNPLLSNLDQFKVVIDDATYLGGHFKPAVVSSKRDDHNWYINVESPIMKGDLQVSDTDIMKNGITIDLSYLNANAFTMDREEQVNPREIPPIKFFSKKIEYNDWQLDKVSFVSAPFVSGMRIHSLTVDDSALNIRADGEWVDTGRSQQQTNLHIVINTENLGSGITKLGYVDFIKDGQGGAEFNIRWPGSPAGFDYGLLQGNVNFAFTKGQILDVDPGAGGRVFSLINMQTLPRRLALDFKDVFSKGFRFDDAKGDFVFSDGNAYTSNFVIEGPAARMDIKGRTGLVERDYDQNVTIETELSAGLPVIGAILGGTTGGLAGILVDRIAKMLGKQAKDRGTLYTVKGSWDEPVIEKVKKPKKDQKKNTNKEISS